MRDFSRDRRSGGGRDFKRRDFDRPQVMHKTICSNCGKECEVPFKPNGSKPVFCRECFQNNRTSEPVRSENFPRRSNFEDRGNNQVSRPVAEPQYREQFESLNTKLDKILNLLAPKETVKEPVVIAPVTVVEPKVKKIKLSEAKSSSAGKRVSKKSPAN